METIEGQVASALNSKQATITGAATTITNSNLTTNRALVSDSSGKVGVSAITSTELGYLDGVTSNIQTQLNNKQPTITGSASTITTTNLTANRVLITSGMGGKVAVSGITSTELNYLDNVKSNIQTQLDGKEPTITTLPIAKGGTGATTAAAARTNLETAYCQIKTAATPAAQGWYRIAQTAVGIGLAMGTFEIKAAASNRHSVTTLTAGTCYGSNVSLQQLSHNNFGQQGITQARIVYHKTYTGNYAYLEVYSPHTAALTITVKLAEGYGWTLLDPSTAGSIPSGYSTESISFSYNSMITKTLYASEGISTTQNAYNEFLGYTILGYDPALDYVEGYAPMQLYDTLSVDGGLTLGTPLTVANGGTGKSTFTSGQALIGNGTGAIQTRAITDKTASALSSTSTNLITERSVTYAIANLVNSAPETLNTLNELAAALGDDPNFATTVATEIGKKENAFSVLPITKGGTGATTVANALKNLGLTATADQINNVNKEAYLTWGGKNFTASFGPIDAALAPELGSNRLAYGHPDGITVEYSRDGGTTWIDYEMNPANKVKLVTPGMGSVTMVAGKGDSTANGNIAGNQNYQSRIILSSASLPLYTALNKFIILASTNGFANCWCTIEKKVGTAWSVLADKVGISGWSGYNVINIPNTVFGTGSGHANEIRLTFGGTGQTTHSQYAGLGIYSIAAFGGVGWTTPSTLAKFGRIYSLDVTSTLSSTGKPIPIVTFPSQVKISDTTAPVNTATGALVVSGGVGIGGDIRVANNAVVTGKIVAGANGTAATTNKLTVYGQSQFNGNAAITGTLNISGVATVKTLTISDTSAIGHLNFSRTGAPNYVVAPDKIAFNVGSSLSLETCALVVASNYVIPGASKYSTLGTESNLWKGVYAANVRANSVDAKGLQENQIRVWHSESETDSLYLFGNQDGRRGLYDTDIGSIISIGPDYVNFNSWRSVGSQWARGREVAPFRSTFVPDRTFNSWSAFFPIFSRKTKLGSWEAGCLMPGTNDYNADDTYNAGSQPSAEHNKLFYEAFHFVHTYDDTYTSNTHTVPLRIFGNGLVLAQKLGVNIAGGYGSGDPPAGTAGDPLFVGQLYFKIIE